MALLDDYLTRSELARELKKSERTIARWQDLPDGLPYTKLGGEYLYRKTSVLEWIGRRECRPNPRRKVA